MLVWFTFAAATAIIAQAEAQACYSTDGSLATNMYPCFPDRPISQCCTNVDYCLSNGLCMDAGGDNDITVEGCTDQEWSAPCNTYCPRKYIHRYTYITVPEANEQLCL